MANRKFYEGKLRNILRARHKSVVGEVDKEQIKHDDAVFREGYEEGVNIATWEAFKKGFAATALILALSLGALGIKGLTGMAPVTNPSVEAGMSAVSASTYRAADPQYYFYKYEEIAANYDDSVDFDSFVYGTFERMGWNEKSTLDCMDDLFYSMHIFGITDYHNFVDYCDSKGVCKEVDGKKVVDTDKYRKAIKEYLKNMAAVDELNEEIDGFKLGQ